MTSTSLPASPHISQVSRCAGWVRAGGWFRTWPARVPAAARALIDRVVSAGTVTKADVNKLQDIRAKAQFLFGPDIFELLSKVSKNVSALNAVSYGPARLPSVHDHAEDAQIREVLLEQFFELSAVAAPYMKMDQKRVPFAINYRRGFFR